MSFKQKIKKVFSLLINNKKVLENYFFMTLLQVLNSFFYFLIYPFLIRKLGVETYGLFVFATSITTYFIYFVNFGFDMPSTKLIAENIEDRKTINNTLSLIFSAKLYLFILSLLILIALCMIIPMLRKDYLVYILCFFQVISFVLFPQWYFQAIQNMRVVTFIQLGVKLLSLPIILYCISSSEDLLLYVSIVSLSSIVGGLIAFFIIRFKEGYRLRLMGLRNLVHSFKEAYPFFLSTVSGVIKEQSIPLIIGSFFSMKDVAIFDLANKLILLPRTLFMSVNAAMFPKMVKNIDYNKIKKIITIETIIALVVVLVIALIGPFAVHFMGGEEMASAYPITLFLSFTVLSWLVVGAYISFVFIPRNQYFLVSKNQLVALVSFFIYAGIGMIVYPHIIVLAASIALSGITEIIFCKIVTKKYKLL